MLKRFALVLPTILSLFLSLFPVSAQENGINKVAPELGDINQDGIVDSLDLSLMKYSMLHSKTNIDKQADKLMDMDSNGKIDSFDYALLKRKIINIGVKRVFAQSSSSNETIHRILDNDLKTRWTSNESANQWIQIELPEKYHLSGTKIYWGTEYAITYSVYTSTDSVNWNLVHETLNGKGKIENQDFDSDKAKYVKFQFNELSSMYGYSIDEIELFCTNNFVKSKIPLLLLPTSGYEVTYEPEDWNTVNDVKEHTNCYAYSLNLKADPKTGKYFPLPDYYSYALQPGELSKTDIDLFKAIEDPQGTDFISACRKDAEAIGGLFLPLKKEEKPPEGTYKVALFFDLGNDYHWYRQNKDGFWSHKLGAENVQDIDAVFEKIYDPEICSKSNSGLEYKTFIGYFAVKDVNPKDSKLVAMDKIPGFDPTQPTRLEPQFSKKKIKFKELISSIDLEMGKKQIHQLIGKPNRQFGSGIVYDVYDFEDGSFVSLYFDSNEKLKKMNYIEK